MLLLNESVVLVTGANVGLGREFVRQLLERGAAKVYAAARRPDRPGLGSRSSCFGRRRDGARQQRRDHRRIIAPQLADR